ncbi:MAG: DUF488 domain-containing protein [Deinococcus sp.]
MLFTIGYEGVSPEALIETLRDHGVEVLVDVRERAQSRRAGFSKTALRLALEEAGLEYRHLRALGTPPVLRKPYKLDHDFAALERGYLAHLAAQEEALNQLGNWAREARVCLLCYEAEPTLCHRSLIGRRLMDLRWVDGVESLRAG